MADPIAAASPTKLAKAPLVHALAQVRYASVLGISSFITGIQEGLSRAGFPRFERSEVQNIVLAPTSAPRVDKISRWDFLSRDRRTGVVISPDFVVLQTSNYDTFGGFGQSLREVLNIFASKVDAHVLVERLGVRYVDLVRLGEGETFSQYLKPGLVGFPFESLGNKDMTKILSGTQSVAQMKDGSVLVVRCSQVDNGQFLPPDLFPSGLEYGVSLRPNERVAILDFDHYTTVDMDLVPEAVVTRLNGLHTGANAAFRASLLPHALEAWGGMVP
jgi:uncharacterized protein (TIGR04255 family)